MVRFPKKIRFLTIFLIKLTFFEVGVKLTISSIEHDQFGNQKILKKKLLEIDNKIKSLEEKYLFESFDKSAYEKHIRDLITEKSKNIWKS